MATEHSTPAISKGRDLTGQHFGEWTVLSYTRTQRYGAKGYIRFWLCHCSCGTEREVRGPDIVHGNSTSCGCKGIARLQDMVEDLAGQSFSRWTVLRRLTDHIRHGEKLRWVCRCECGTEKDIAGHDLRNGQSKSCGCLKIDTAGDQRRTHGQSGNFHKGIQASAEYRIWIGMKNRCYVPSATGYANYGGRGITVCDRWNESFEAFLEDMGPKPSPTHSIDRFPDSEGNYCPENCRWATRTQQNRNTRKNHLLTYRGETLSIAEWAERLKLDPRTLCMRIIRGWTTERAIETPVY